MKEKAKNEQKQQWQLWIKRIVGLLLIITGIGMLWGLQNVSEEFIPFQLIISVLFILTGFGLVINRIKQLYKNLAVVVLATVVFFSFFLFPTLKVVSDVTSKESFIELSKVYWRIEVEKYFSTTPYKFTQFGRIFCYGVDFILGVPVPCDLINTQNIDRIVEYIAERKYYNSDIERIHMISQSLQYPILASGILFSFFILLIQRSPESFLKILGAILLIIGILLSFSTPLNTIQSLKNIPQFKDVSDETLAILYYILQPKANILGNFGIVYLAIGVVFLSTAIFIKKQILLKVKDMHSFRKTP